MSISSTISGVASPEMWTSTGRPTGTRACLRRFWRTGLACCGLARLGFLAVDFTIFIGAPGGLRGSNHSKVLEQRAATDSEVRNSAKDAERRERGSALRRDGIACERARGPLPTSPGSRVNRRAMTARWARSPTNVAVGRRRARPPASRRRRAASRASARARRGAAASARAVAVRGAPMRRPAAAAGGELRRRLPDARPIRARGRSTGVCALLWRTVRHANAIAANAIVIATAATSGLRERAARRAGAGAAARGVSQTRLTVNVRAPSPRDRNQAQAHQIVERLDLSHARADRLQPRAQRAAAVGAQHLRREHARARRDVGRARPEPRDRARGTSG